MLSRDKVVFSCLTATVWLLWKAARLKAGVFETRRLIIQENG
jgi:hypothetical protein